MTRIRPPKGIFDEKKKKRKKKPVFEVFMHRSQGCNQEGFWFEMDKTDLKVLE